MDGATSTDPDLRFYLVMFYRKFKIFVSRPRFRVIVSPTQVRKTETLPVNISWHVSHLSSIYTTTQVRGTFVSVGPRGEKKLLRSTTKYFMSSHLNVSEVPGSSPR